MGMTGMILAAGFGTRLGSMTESVPKPLVHVGGKAMIDHAIERLASAGCSRIVVNTHHFPEHFAAHFSSSDYDAEIVLLHEEAILGTGGAILHAAPYLAQEEQFFVHNADIVSDCDLEALMSRQRNGGTFATLLVQARPTTRALLVRADGSLAGKESWGLPESATAGTRRFGFCGIHAVSSGIFSLGLEIRYADIFEIYREALDRGVTIGTVPCDGYWNDLGTEERIRVHETRLSKMK
jgi:NDP-sugar pyrophosphorylase family protein